MGVGALALIVVAAALLVGLIILAARRKRRQGSLRCCNTSKIEPERKYYLMEYWSARHRHKELSETERASRIDQLLREVSLPRQTPFDYFAVCRATDGSSHASQVTIQYFSSFNEARDWWAGLSRNSYQLDDGSRLVDRLSGTKKELLSAFGQLP